MTGPLPTPIADRFWPKVNKTETCWLWMAGKSHDGYGFIGLSGRGAGKVYAHRYAYESLTGPIPAGMQLDHLCRVRHCVNPAHLEPVTNKENHARTPKATKTHCIRGHEYAAGHLTINNGRRACRTCNNERNRQQKSLVPCGRCGVPCHRAARGGWRHAVNRAGKTCGQPPLIDCHPLLAPEAALESVTA